MIELPKQQQGPVKQALVPILKDYEGEKAISSALKGLLVQGNPVAYVCKSYSSPILRFDDTSATGYGQLAAALARSGFIVETSGPAPTAWSSVDASVLIVLEPHRDFLKRDADSVYEFKRRGGGVHQLCLVGDPRPEPDRRRLRRALGL